MLIPKRAAAVMRYAQIIVTILSDVIIPKYNPNTVIATIDKNKNHPALMEYFVEVLEVGFAPTALSRSSFTTTS